jgi:hypothetical protein
MTSDIPRRQAHASSTPIFTEARRALPYNRGIKWSILTALIFCSSVVLAQEAVDISAEPHCRMLLENEQVRVFALTLHLDESALERFRHSFLTIALQEGEIIIGDEGRSPIQHFQVHKGETSFRCWSSVCISRQQQRTGVAGGFRNDRQNDYRNITVEFLDPNIGWSTPEGGTIIYPASMFLEGAIVADFLLQADDSYPVPDKRGRELVIPVSNVDLKGAGGTRIRKSPGAVAWIPANQISSLTNVGRDPARFIAVQFRPGDSTAPAAADPGTP